MFSLPHSSTSTHEFILRHQPRANLTLFVSRKISVTMSTKKRPQTLDNFFSPPPLKRVRASPTAAASGGDELDATTHHNIDIEQPLLASRHPTYPFPIPHLPADIQDALNFAPAEEPQCIADQPDLDLLYFQPYIPKSITKPLFQFLRAELPFYRVQYTIKRGPTTTQINTPRFTTVFGVDATSYFSSFTPTTTTSSRTATSANGTNSNAIGSTISSNAPATIRVLSLLDSTTHKPIPKDRYKCAPRPIPQCLDALRILTEGSTGQTYNFCLVNYYASGSDSISYHSDDERFLGVEPTIASFSLGAKRDFLMRHKPAATTPAPPPDSSSGTGEAGGEGVTSANDINAAKPLKLPLGSGDMILMRGRTQSCWLHSIPKRKGGESEQGRINITFRKALVKGGTENYYQYNVGYGGAMKWDERKREMVSC